MYDFPASVQVIVRALDFCFPSLFASSFSCNSHPMLQYTVPLSPDLYTPPRWGCSRCQLSQSSTKHINTSGELIWQFKEAPREHASWISLSKMLKFTLLCTQTVTLRVISGSKAARESFPSLSPAIPSASNFGHINSFFSQLWSQHVCWYGFSYLGVAWRYGHWFCPTCSYLLLSGAWSCEQVAQSQHNLPAHHCSRALMLVCVH